MVSQVLFVFKNIRFAFILSVIPKSTKKVLYRNSMLGPRILGKKIATNVNN